MQSKLEDSAVNVKAKIAEKVDQIEAKLKAISSEIFNQPELGYQEYKAMKLLSDFLEENGFTVQRGVAGMATAFWAEYLIDREEAESQQKVPTIAFLAEYDALPDLGHACGHNLIGAASVGAAVGLARFLKSHTGPRVKIVVVGTPAEETSGGKVELIKAGYFENIDAAMMIHPGDRTVVNVTSLALDALEFVFLGKAAHAASASHKGINALDAAINFFNGISALRLRFKEDVKIHGIITEGGVVPNIIPERAVARFYIRAQERKLLDQVVKEVEKCALGAAQMIGAEVSWYNYETSYDNMVTNEELARIFKENLRYLGVSDIEEEKGGLGSIDMGNVSQLVPSIHPYIAIGPKGLEAHTREFAAAVCSEEGYKGMLLGAKALALTAFDFLIKK